jgi:hypothetical protein
LLKIFLATTFVVAEKFFKKKKLGLAIATTFVVAEKFFLSFENFFKKKKKNLGLAIATTKVVAENPLSATTLESLLKIHFQQRLLSLLKSFL